MKEYGKKCALVIMSTCLACGSAYAEEESPCDKLAADFPDASIPEVSGNAWQQSDACLLELITQSGGTTETLEKYYDFKQSDPDLVSKITFTTGSEAGDDQTVTVLCEPESQPTGGGYNISGSDNNIRKVVVTSSQPTAEGWRVAAQVVPGARLVVTMKNSGSDKIDTVSLVYDEMLDDTVTITPYVVCAVPQSL